MKIRKKEEFYRRIRPVFGIEDKKKAAAYCMENWPEETAHVIRTAKEACCNTFLFDFPWDMERTYEPVTFEKEIDWSLIPFGDREFLWQFNRHRFLLCLGQAYHLTGEEQYAFHYVRLMRDWMERAEPGEAIDLGPWRTLETGIRAENWLRSLALVEESESVSDGFIEEVEQCLGVHGERLLEHFKEHKYISNWGVLESSGLLLLSLIMPEENEKKTEYETAALKRLEQAAAIQVLPDGTQWEQSPMYHNEVYHCFLNAYYYGTHAGLVLPEIIGETVRKMAYVNGFWIKPDHTQFAQGDSDTSDLRDQITAGAIVLKDPVLKFWGYEKADYESTWQFGMEECETYKAMKKKEPSFVSAELPFSGNYYLRSGWGKDDNLLHFHCGETGGGHGHADKLHVDLVINGEDVLVDSGRYTYVDGPDRFAFKEPGGHNVSLVDGEPFSRCETSWIYKELCTCLKQQYYEGHSGAYVEGSHMGYLDRGVLVNRKIIWIKPEVYVLVDDFYGTGRHTLESLYHFSRSGSVSCGEKGILFEGNKTKAFIQFPNKDETLELYATEQSCHYNEKSENKTCRAVSTAEGFYSRIAVINGGPKETAEPAQVERLGLWSVVHEKTLDRKDAEALKIIVSGKEYILFFTHREVLTPTDILRYENCLGYGKAVLFDRSEEKEQVVAGEILAW